MASNFTIATTFTAVDRMSTTMGKIQKQGLSMGKALGAIGAVAALGAAADAGLDLSARMTRLGTNMGISADKTKALTSQILDVSKAAGINIDSSQLISSIEQVTERTGDFKFAEDNLRNMALAIQATGASGEDIGGMFSEFEKMGLGANQAMAALDSLTVQGKKGAFTMRDLATLAPRTVAAYSATGRTGVEALREMGAALQVIRQGTGSSEQAATSFEAVMRNVTDPKKQKMLKDMGVSVRDAGKNFRPITEIMSEIVTKSGGSIEKIGQIFDAESVRAFNSSLSEFQRTGAVNSLREFYQITGDGSTIMADSARNAAEAKAEITALQGELNKNISDVFIDLAPSLISLTGALKPVLKTLAESINQIVGFVAGNKMSDRSARQSVGVLDVISNPAASIGKLWDKEQLAGTLKDHATWGTGMSLNDWQIERLGDSTNQKTGMVETENALGLGPKLKIADVMNSLPEDQRQKYQAVLNNNYTMKTENGKTEIVVTFANTPPGTGVKQSGQNAAITTNLGAASSRGNRP